jgi:hypothetical protein
MKRRGALKSGNAGRPETSDLDMKDVTAPPKLFSGVLIAAPSEKATIGR